MLVGKQLQVRYQGTAGPVDAVKGLDLSVAPGRMLALIGESGSGKTATALALLGMLPTNASTAGEWFWQGEKETVALSALSPPERQHWAGRHLGWVAQGAQSALNPTRSVGSLLQEAMRFHRPGLNADQRQAEIERLCEQLALDPGQAPAFPHQLSGGQRQRWMLALALSTKPDILIADEPTTALDPIAERGLMELLRQLQTELPIGILLITHDLDLVERYADEAIMLAEGTVIARGAVRDWQTGNAPEPVVRFRESWQNLTAGPASAPKAPLLTADDISFTYRKRGQWWQRAAPIPALNQVSITIQPGERIGLLGRSGSGKSTLGKIIAGLLSPGQGQLQWGEQTPDAAERRCQLLLQNPYTAFHPRFLIGDSLRQVAKKHRPDLTPAARQALIQQRMEQVGLPKALEQRYPNTLSGGQLQRAALARTLLLSPALLILDESLASLDRFRQAQLIQLLHELRDTENMAMLMISHDARVLEASTERLMILERGSVLAQGPVTAAYPWAEDELSRQLLGLPPSL